MDNTAYFIFFMLWVSSIAFCTWAAGKMGKSKIIGFGIGMIFVFLGPIVYAFLLHEFKKKGKAESKII